MAVMVLTVGDRLLMSDAKLIIMRSVVTRRVILIGVRSAKVVNYLEQALSVH